jgi:hypothetical protein
VLVADGPDATVGCARRRVRAGRVYDSVVGDIAWLAPYSDEYFALFHVEAMFKPWWLNFILHWSFALELLLVALAVYLWRRDHARYW